MKRSLSLLVGWMMLLFTPSFALAGGVRLQYGFAPGQQWECTRLSRTEFDVMGKKQVQRQKNVIAYTVSEGPQKGWVHLTARYIDPPPKTPENQYAQGQYVLRFAADVHGSGDTRNIQVTGMDQVPDDPALPPQVKAALVQNNQILAQSLKPAVFWFPELPEEPLEPGDEFEVKRTHGVDDPNMASQTKVRTVFTLGDVSEGLAYFDTKERHDTKMATAGGKMDLGSAGKGEIIFDTREGMWIEYVNKSKMNFSGAMMGSQSDQEMLITEKITMQRK